MNKKAIDLGDFDFGFTLATADDIDEVKNFRRQTEELSEEASEWRDKAIAIYDSIQPLLNNLSGDSSRDYIYWPGKMRVSKIQEFKLKLESILN